MKNEDIPDSQVNGDKETRDELEEGRKDEKNSKMKFMFNIADGGFTGEGRVRRDLCTPGRGERGGVCVCVCVCVCVRAP